MHSSTPNYYDYILFDTATACEHPHLAERQNFLSKLQTYTLGGTTNKVMHQSHRLQANTHSNTAREEAGASASGAEVSRTSADNVGNETDPTSLSLSSISWRCCKHARSIYANQTILFTRFYVSRGWQKQWRVQCTRVVNETKLHRKTAARLPLLPNHHLHGKLCSKFIEYPHTGGRQNDDKRTGRAKLRKPSLPKPSKQEGSQQPTEQRCRRVCM